MTEQEAREALDQAMTTFLLDGSAASRQAFLDAQAQFDRLRKQKRKEAMGREVQPPTMRR